MKKLLCLLMALMMVLPFAACGDDNGEETKASEDSQSATQAAGESDAQVETTAPEESQEATIEETVLYDENNIKITALSLTYDDTYVNLNLRIENNTDTDLSFLAYDTTVNDFVVEGLMAEDVASGEQVDGRLFFRKKWLQDDGIDVIADIEARFSYYTDDYMVDGDTDMIEIKTSAAEGFDYSYDESGSVIYDQDGVKIVFQRLFVTDNTYDGDTEYYPIIFIKNESDEIIYVQDTEVRVNGIEVDATFGEFVYTGKRMISEVSLYEDNLAENGITEFESLEMAFEITRGSVLNSGENTELVEVELEQ
ncbi:MAG: hypothetical protein IJV88_01285 [Ruminococcus sp.]|nr:hypothetical protein [Ruminococcus sp.]